MIYLKALFKRDTLNQQGTRLSKIITEKLLNSGDECVVDFTDVSTVTPLFFRTLFFPSSSSLVVIPWIAD